MVEYPMKHRDGIPILIKGNKHNISQTKGYILNFKDNQEAYRIISQTISNSLYEWGIIIIGKKVNVLFGKDPKLGSNHIENHEDRICFNGRNDPLFKEGINLIRKNLESEGFSWETGFFELQMNYMLLWSAIDRYCKLKYNQKMNIKIV